MKKVKIMLLSLSVLAIVGGALAFKARAIQEFCTAAWNGSNCNLKCPNLVTSTTTTNVAQGEIYCTTTPAITENPADPTGPQITTCVTSVNQLPVQLNCNTTVRIKPN